MSALPTQALWLRESQSPLHLVPIDSWGVTFHLLLDIAKQEVVILDSGLMPEIAQVLRTLQFWGLGWSSVKALLLTHGHLDHTGNLARLKALTGAPLFAHPAEQAHINGTFPYRGANRICGALEAAGRFLFFYRPVEIDEPLKPGVELPFWGGLRVVHLPGHTEGHCGFYSPSLNLLFSGDIFASYPFRRHVPPFFLNSCPEKMEGSLNAIQTLNPRYILPNHYTAFDGELHRRNFDALMDLPRRKD